MTRHEALRTSFAVIDGVPLQVIKEMGPLELPVIDLSHLGQTEREAETYRLLGVESRRSFDLSNGPLIRAVMLRLQEREHTLLVTMHHIVTDGWSMGVFHRELMALYEAFSNGKPSPSLNCRFSTRTMLTGIANGSRAMYINRSSLIGRNNSRLCRQCLNYRRTIRGLLSRLIALSAVQSGS